MSLRRRLGAVPEAPVWIFFGCIALVLLSLYSYFRDQAEGSLLGRMVVGLVGFLGVTLVLAGVLAIVFRLFAGVPLGGSDAAIQIGMLLGAAGACVVGCVMLLVTRLVLGAVLWPRFWLSVCRSLVLILLFVMLADPQLSVAQAATIARSSMCCSTAPTAWRSRTSCPMTSKTLEAAVGPLSRAYAAKPLPPPAGDLLAAPGRPARSRPRPRFPDGLRAGPPPKPENNLLDEAAERQGVPLEAFLFDGNTTSQLRKLALSQERRPGASIPRIWPSSSRRRGR